MARVGLLVAGFAAALVTMPGLALAQSAAAPAGAGTPGAGTPAAASAGMDKRVEARIKDLHTRLKITSAQEPQFQAFAQVMRDNAMHMESVFAQRPDPGKATALEDMRAYAQMADAHAEDMKRLLPAFETLYNSMAPEQQRVADAAFRDFQKREGRMGKG